MTLHALLQPSPVEVTWDDEFVNKTLECVSSLRRVRLHALSTVTAVVAPSVERGVALERERPVNHSERRKSLKSSR